MKKHYAEIIKAKDVGLLKKHLANIKKSNKELRKDIKEIENLIACDLRDEEYLEAQIKKLEAGKK
jgi:hypothetical protein